MLLLMNKEQIKASLRAHETELKEAGIVAAGEVWLERDYLKPLFRSVEPPGPAPVRLTEKERQVLRAVFEGFANKQIAARLQVSETSVKGILQQLFQKTGVRTRTQLVRIALERYRDQL